MSGRERSLARARPTKTPSQRILILCEGEETEPAYFRELIRRDRIPTASVKVQSARHGDPKTILQEAQKYLKNDDYDLIYCVFDHDGRDHAPDVVKNINRSEKMKAIYSRPCIELFFLLHFIYTSSEFSGPKEVIEKLKKHHKNYEKNGIGFDELFPRTEAALGNADRLQNARKQDPAITTETNVQELVRTLQEMARP